MSILLINPDYKARVDNRCRTLQDAPDEATREILRERWRLFDTGRQEALRARMVQALNVYAGSDLLTAWENDKACWTTDGRVQWLKDPEDGNANGDVN